MMEGRLKDLSKSIQMLKIVIAMQNLTLGAEFRSMHKARRQN